MFSTFLQMKFTIFVPISPELLNIYLYQIVKNFMETEKKWKVTNSVIIFALKCQFKRFKPI